MKSLFTIYFAALATLGSLLVGCGDKSMPTANTETQSDDQNSKGTEKDSSNTDPLDAHNKQMLPATRLLAAFEGQPEGLNSTVFISVSVLPDNNIVAYKFKLGSNATTDCLDEAGYSGVVIVTTKIQSNISSLQDGIVRLCVVGQNTDGIWQAFSEASTATWFKDSASPSVTAVSPLLGKDSILINATVSDASRLTFAWSKFSGPGLLTFTPTDVLTPSVTADIEGSYVAEVSVTDELGHVATQKVTLNFDRTAPKITAVQIDSTDATSNDPAFTAPGGSGAQLTNAPIARPNRIRVVFNEDVVNLSIANVTVKGLPTFAGGNVRTYAVTNTTYDTVTHSARITFTAPILNADVLTVSLKGTGLSAITDAAGNAMDGEWSNPTCLTDTGSSNFPSGNSTPGGDFDFKFTLLSGDVDVDNFVSTLDNSAVKIGFATTTFLKGDLNGDNIIDSLDTGVVSTYYGRDLRCIPAFSP